MVSYDISFSCALLAFLAIISIYWLWTKSRRPYTKFNIPPFPGKPLPIFGHFFMMFGNVQNNMKEWRKEAGDIYSLNIAGELIILINNFTDMKEIWVKRADYIVNTQKIFGDELANEFDMGIPGARDDNWKEQRTLSLSILRSFGMGKNLMAERIKVEVIALLEKLASFKEEPVDVKLLFNITIANVISAVVSGQRYDYGDPNFDCMVDRIRTYVGYFAQMMMLSSFKEVNYLPGDLFSIKKYVKASLEINEKYSKHFIHKCKQEWNKNEEPHNFITAYLKEMNKKKEKEETSHLDEANLAAIVKVLFAAGTDTTSSTLLWCLLFMLHNPEVQEKVYRELEANVGTARLPALADKQQLTYLNAVIMETQRKASIVPVGFRREVSETFDYGGFTFPKGCIVWPVLDSVLSDEKIWGDPENFRPERFIDQNGALINPEKFIPFGIGRRLCMGEALAKMELFLILSALFQRFRVEPATPGERPTLEASFAMVTVPQPFKLKFIERKT